MTLAYVLDGGMNDQPGAGSELYELFPVVRRCYEEIEEWTGLDAQRIFTEEREAGQEHRQGIGAIRQAAAVFGIADVLAEEYGITPGAVCGLSFGALVGASLAGAVERRDLFTLLMRMREMPATAASDPRGAHGVAAVRIPYDLDLEERLERQDGVYLSADLGRVGAGTERMVLLAGYRSALADFGTLLPPGALQVSQEHGIAFHSPLQRGVRDHLEPTLQEMAFQDPRVPVHSCMEVKTLTTGEEIRDLYRRNPTDPVSVPHMLRGLEGAGTELGLVLGPCSFGTFLGSSFPVVHVESPDHVFEAMTAIYELGIELASN
ncbi:acyltransferase domain-containing protein [Streptomyces palmae]|uniref:[acyl-carrier-protein] S-malonyltransferase n=1 Tax=Streptomyces palmae TaxID=1701085 RepID=A0A4Z0H172_9ACTN|nr:acyltransferase domain-containing protein [Streptomyces palmae]TGB02601.1 ACP S-malonyltransferase [Streptomyces palmae]